MNKEKNKLEFHWETVALRDIVLFAIGGDWGKLPSKTLAGYVEVKVIRGTDFKDWNTDRANNASIRMIQEASLLSRKLNFGDIVVEISGGSPEQPVGRTIIIDDKALDNESQLISSNFFRKITLTKQVSPFFVYYYFQYAYKAGKYNKIQTETTNLRNLQFDSFLNQKIPFPPIEYQLDIVDKLDELFGKLKSTQQIIDKIPGVVKAIKRKILSAAFSGVLTQDFRNKKRIGPSPVQFKNDVTQKVEVSNRDLLPPIPEDWQYSLIADNEIFLGSGTTPKGKNKYLKSGVPFFRSQNIYPEGLRVDEIAYISKETHAKMSRTQLKPGDVLLNITGASIGRATFLPSDFIEGNVNQHVCIIRLREGLMPETISLFLNSDTGQKLIFSSQSGVTREGINHSQVRGLWIPIMPLDEQVEILKIVTRYLERLQKFEDKFFEIKKNLSAVPFRLLQDAFSGKLISTDKLSVGIKEILNEILDERKDLLSTLKLANVKMKKEATHNNQITLEQQILNRFPKSSFYFREIEDMFDISYEESKEMFFELLLSSKIKYTYDEVEHAFLFSTKQV
jgi:type I restriction enzyme S subunit